MSLPVAQWPAESVTSIAVEMIEMIQMTPTGLRFSDPVPENVYDPAGCQWNEQIGSGRQSPGILTNLESYEMSEKITSM